MKLSSLLSGFAGALAMFGALASAPAQAADEPLKVGFVYIGPVGDYGYTWTHDQARKAVQEHFGDQIETSFIENIGGGPDAERALRQMAQNGTDLIFATSFSHMNGTVKAAKQFPKVAFENATGYKTGRNLGIYNARFYEGRYAIGRIAGMMTKSNVVGYVASFPIPEVVRGINAAYLGAKSVNPDIEFKIVWISTWFDPGKEADAARTLVEQGADMLMQHTDGPAVMTTAEELGVNAFGQASSMRQFGPNAELSAVIDDWTNYYTRRIQARLDGTWKPGDVWEGIDMEMVKVGELPEGAPQAVKDDRAATIAGIADGSITIFKGPLNKQDGSVWLKEGEVATDKELLRMDFYVEGLEGTLPQ